MRGRCGTRRAIISLVAHTVPYGVGQDGGGWDGNRGYAGLVGIQKGNGGTIQAITIPILTIEKFHGGGYVS